MYHPLDVHFSMNFITYLDVSKLIILIQDIDLGNPSSMFPKIGKMLSPVFLQKYCLLMTLLLDFLVNFLGIFLIGSIFKSISKFINTVRPHSTLSLCPRKT